METTPAAERVSPSAEKASPGAIAHGRRVGFMKTTPGRFLLVIATITLLVVGTMVIVRGGWHWWPTARAISPDGTDASFHWQEAQQAMANREFRTAIRHLNRCLESWPVNAEAHFVMARTCRRAGDFTTGQTHLDKAAVLGWPKDQIDLERRLRRAQSGDVWNVEDSLIDELNNQPPEEVFILEALVKGLLANDRLVDVHFFTTTWIHRFPGDWLPHLLRGNAIFLLHGQSTDVIRNYEHALELKPDRPEIHLALASLLMANGRYKEALSHFEACLESPADDPAGALVGVANCQFSLGQTQEAQATLDQLFARDPEHGSGFFLRGKIELANGAPEKALSWLRKAETFAPGEMDITSALFQVYRQLGRQQDADTYQTRVEEIRKRNAELDELSRQIKEEPDNIDLRFRAGLISLKLGRTDDASHWFQSILYQDPHHRLTLNALADYYAKKGDKEGENYYRRRAEGKKRGRP